MSKMKANDSRRGIGIFGSVPVYALPKINSVNELKALVGISSYQGTNEEAFPSLEKLAKRIGLSPAATSTAVSGLVRKDLVGRKRNYGRVNTYFLLYETESKQEIREHNNMERKKARAKLLAENIEKHNLKSQSFESLEYSKVSNVSYSNSSNVDDSKVSNDILKEQLKEHNTRFNPETFRTKLVSETKANEPITSLSFLALKERLKQIDSKFGLSYLESSKANQMYEQAAKKYGKGFDEFFLSIIEKLEKLTTKQLDKFKFSQGFTIQSLTRFDLQDCSKVEAWYNAEFPHKQTKSQNKPLDNSQDDDIFIRAIPTLEQLERMYK